MEAQEGKQKDYFIVTLNVTFVCRVLLNKQHFRCTYTVILTSQHLEIEVTNQF